MTSPFTLPEPSVVESMTAEEILSTCLREFPGKVSLACSFQKEEAVLLDMLLALDPNARVFALDTHVLFPETYAVWRAVEQRYGTKVEVYEGPSLGRQAAIHGDELWKSKPDLCCSIRKVAPLARALAELDCWITGMRRDQSPTRANAPKLGWDEQHELWKANPLADWSDDDCWKYIRAHELPYNALHDNGYASIGDTHSTRPGVGREGRWAGTGKVECGIHTIPSSELSA
jgi:phosphoadenosine phosphosulfate reductase